MCHCPDCLYGYMKYHRTACTSLPEDDHWDILNMSKTLLTYSMQQSPSREANRFSASQQIPHILWNPKVHYRSNKCLSLSQLDPVHTPTSKRSILIFIFPSMFGSSKWSVHPSDGSRQVSPPKPCICLSSPPYVLHAPPISFFFILSPKQYWVRCIDH
jgi:hypothetical protein